MIKFIAQKNDEISQSYAHSFQNMSPTLLL